MRRTKENLLLYKKTCNIVWERASGYCEVLVDGKRCPKYISFEDSKFINYLHKDTRNGKSDDWVLDPKQIIFGCAEHHIEEEQTGERVEGVEYEEDELIYLPDEQ